MNTHPSEDNLSLAFKKDTVEFVTVAAAFCHFLENASHYERSVFIDKALKLAALLYLKALSLPAGDRINETDPETFVTEHEYNLLCGNIAAVMADLDSYVDAAHNGVFYEESTTQFISEKLADVYQSVKNFICVYKLGFEPTMHDALLICHDQFDEYWGATLVGVMRPLHDVRLVDAETERNENTNQDSGLRAWNADENFSESDLYEGLDMGEDDNKGF